MIPIVMVVQVLVQVVFTKATVSQIKVVTEVTVHRAPNFLRTIVGTVVMVETTNLANMTFM
jgi:hypothetical protein